MPLPPPTSYTSAEQVARAAATKSNKPIYGASDSAELQRLQQQANLGSQDLSHATGMQQQTYNAFGGLASGQSSSLADAQMKAALARTQANSQALAGQTRGGNTASAEQAAMIANFAGQSQGAADAAAIAAQQEMQAMQAQAAIAGQMAGQGLEQQLGIEGIIGQGQLGQMNAQVESQLGNRELALAEKNAKAQRIMDAIKTGASVAGSVGGAVMSDERAKDAIAPSGMAATHAVAETDPITFNYKPGYGPSGRQVGIDAASLARTPEGAQAVVTDPDTGMRMVDPGRLSTINTAALAELVPRIEQLERTGGSVPRTAPRQGQYTHADDGQAIFPAIEQGRAEHGDKLARALRDARERRQGSGGSGYEGYGSDALAGEAVDAGIKRAGTETDMPPSRLQALRDRVAAMRADPKRFAGVKSLVGDSRGLAQAGHWDRDLGARG